MGKKNIDNPTRLIIHPENLAAYMSGSGTSVGSLSFEIIEIGESGNSPWDDAYVEFMRRKKKNNHSVFIEPDVKTLMNIRPPKKKLDQEPPNEYLDNWPKPAGADNEFIWHLDEQHSQLQNAEKAVREKVGDGARIRIGHIDTGYREHPTAPLNLQRDLGVSFVRNEFGINKGLDILNTGRIAEQDGHGCATLAILAGNQISKSQSYGDYEGFFGAIPFAEVIPIRISDTVYTAFNANDVALGIDYAIDNHCEVITMSMAGFPTKRVAEAVNRAYENGIIIVAGAGNNWTKGILRILPKAVMYPARFERVIAATGVCYNHKPYNLAALEDEGILFDPEFMQGNWGPENAMRAAIAACTPNLAWVTVDRSYMFSKAGAGNSSSTPQVAAAAALWIVYNRDLIRQNEIESSWKKVEAAKTALFRSASKEYSEYEEYYGNGELRAFDALESFDFSMELDTLQQSEEAQVIFGGLFQLLDQWLSMLAEKNEELLPLIQDDNLKEMLSLEIIQLLYKDKKLFSYANTLNFENDELEVLYNPQKNKQFFRRLKQSKFASAFLKSLLPDSQ
jgi:Subtilase family